MAEDKSQTVEAKINQNRVFVDNRGTDSQIIGDAFISPILDQGGITSRINPQYRGGSDTNPTIKDPSAPFMDNLADHVGVNNPVLDTVKARNARRK